jgi:Kef-type K+ transport system membrane component KefB
VDLFYVLLVLLVLTRAVGEAAERLNQPALVGELIAGLALSSRDFQDNSRISPTSLTTMSSPRSATWVCFS